MDSYRNYDSYSISFGLKPLAFFPCKRYNEKTRFCEGGENHAAKALPGDRYGRDRKEYHAVAQGTRHDRPGKSLPTVDNLYALSALLDVPMEKILVSANVKPNIIMLEQQDEPCCSNHLEPGCFGYDRKQKTLQPFLLMQCA